MWQTGTVSHDNCRCVEGSPHSALEEELARRIGLRLQQLRIDRGLSQTEMANRSGMSRTHYQRLEHGRGGTRGEQPSNPRLASLIGIADVLGVTPAELVETLLKDYSG